MENSILQIFLAVIAVIPGLIALINQYRKNKRDAAAAQRDDEREDFAALFEAAKSLGDAGTTLVEPLTETIKKLRQEMTERERSARRELDDLGIRLTAAERQIEELISINTKLADTNERYESFFNWLSAELGRLAKVDPVRFPKEGGIPEFTKER